MRMTHNSSKLDVVMAHYTFLERISGVNVVMADLAQGLCDLAGMRRPTILTFDGTPGAFEHFDTVVLDEERDIGEQVAQELTKIPKPMILQCHNFHIPLFFDMLVKPFIEGAIATNTRITNAIHDYSSNDTETAGWLADRGVTFTAVSEAIGARVEADGFEYTVVPNCINTQKFYPNPEARMNVRRQLKVPDDAFLIGSYARAVPRKQFPLLVEVFADVLKETDKDLRLHIRAIPSTVEPGKTDVVIDEIQKAIQSRAVESNTILETEPVSWARSLAPYFNGADLMVYPSINEGFGLQLPEAVATGTMFICSDIPCYRELVEKLLPGLEDDTLFRAGDRESMVRALLKAIEDPELKTHQHVPEARERVKAFYGLQNMVEGYIEVFKANAFV